MTTPAVTSFVHVLCQSRLLDEQQRAKLMGKLQHRFADPHTLAQDLIRRGWLSPQQTAALLGGQAAPASAAGYAERKAVARRRWMMFNVVGLIVLLSLGGVVLYVIRQDRLGARDKADAARLAALEAQAQAELKPLRDGFDAPNRHDANLRKQLHAFRIKYAEVPSAMQAAHLLAVLPSPLDTLDKATIAHDEQEKGQPDNLVAVLGHRRWRHWGPVRAVAVSGNGATVATGGEDGQVRLWERANGREIAAIPAANPVALAFVPGDKMLAVHTGDGNVSLYHADKGTKYGDYPGPATNVVSAAFTRDGLTAASAQQDGLVKVWELQTGKVLGELRGHKQPVNAIAFAPDGATVATAGGEGAVILWDPSGNAKIQLTDHTDAVTAAAFSPDSKLLATGGGPRDGTVVIWDAAKGEALQRIEGHEGAVHALAFDAAIKHIISGSADQSVRRTELRLTRPKPLMPVPPPNPNNENPNQADNQNQNTDAATPPPPPPAPPPAASYKFLGHVGAVLALCVHGEADNETIVAADAAGTVRLWSVRQRGDFSGVRDHLGPITSLVFLDDQVLASGSLDKTVRVWDANGTVPRMVFAGHTAGVSSVSFAPMQKLLASGSYDGTVRLWDQTNSKELASLAPHLGPVLAVGLAPDGKSLVAGATSSSFQGGELKIWDPAIFKERGTLPVHQDVVSSVAFAPDGRTFASGSHDGTVQLFEPWTGVRRGILTDKAAVECLAFGPDGKHLAVGTHARVVKLWDAAAKEEKRTLTGLTALCKSLAYSPDGQWLAGTQTDGRVLVWNTASGEARAWKLPGPVAAVAFAPDSRHLATGNGNGTIYLLRLAEAPKKGRK